MENKRKFEDIFDDYTYTNRVDESLKNYSSWLLGISLGLAAILISLISSKTNAFWYFIISLILVFAGILLNGFIKYQIFNREILMNTQFGALKQIEIKRKSRPQSDLSNNDTIDKEKWTIAFNKYMVESNKIATIAKHMNWSTYFTFFNVLITGFTIIMLIIKNACQHSI